MTDPYFPALHRTHPRGWINDPNGVCRVDGRWHVFFQYNPHSARHDRIHWGHVSSDDLVTWREEPLGPVPRPGEADADGCWSGVATVEDGVPYAVYSGVSGADHHVSRVVVQRGRADLTSFEALPGVAADLPDEPGLVGVRDPFLFEVDGLRLAVQGAELHRTEADGTVRPIPAILAWDRSDLAHWRYLGSILTGEDAVAARLAPADLWECPQLVRLGDRWVLSVSLWTEPERAGGSSLGGVAYLVGDLHVERSTDGMPQVRYAPTAGGIVDEGPDFYAPQAVVDADGDRVLLWGWSWEGAARTQEQTDAQGWAGTLTFPRELALERDLLVSRVPAELAALRGADLPTDGTTIELGTPAAAQVDTGDGVRVELVGVDGTVRDTVVAVDGGAVTVLVDASLVEVLPAHGTPRTVRVYPAAGESLRLTGADLRATTLRVPGA
ncbi:glycoside hydrolase family 32 protein [Brachybacterium sp. AOP25-B2-12]|uniref:glycoside hydrolase family 32 protein n=1 Tax=Brachybacterium sp. AOP25-B2-12 TaxID=3457710 RepID=UPI0040339348